MGVFFMVNSNVVTGTNPQVSPCIGNHIYNKSRTSVATSGSGGKNYGTEIRTVRKLKMQDLSGVSVSLNMGK